MYFSFFYDHSDMCGCSDQRLLAMISDNNQKRNDDTSKVEVEVEKNGRTRDEAAPLVCLRTVLKDARTAELAEEKVIPKVLADILISRSTSFFSFKMQHMFFF